MALYKLQCEAQEAKARVFSMHDGEQDRGFLVQTARYLTTVIVACGFDKLAQNAEYNYDELIGLLNKAMDHLVRMGHNDSRWNYAAASDIVDAIEATILLAPRLSQEAIDHGLNQTRPHR